MAHYLAICRKAGESTPNKIALSANTVGEAINQMREKAGVHDTSAFDAYELLEVTDGGKAYIPVASKDAPEVKQERLKRRAHKNLKALTVVIEVAEEPAYDPYQVEEAA